MPMKGKKPDIKINPANKGKYTARAKAHGNTVEQQTQKDLKSGSSASASVRKEAVFAKNAKKWKK